MIPTDVAQYAQIWNEARGDDIKIFALEHIKEEARNAIATVKPDIFVCFAYGHILGPKFFSLFKYGGVNLHPSLLPKYRGATPVNAAILNQDTETGYALQKMSLGIDEGDILFMERVGLTGTETSELLLNKFALYGGIAITNLLRQTAKTGSLPDAFPQSGSASYCTTIKKEDGRINWQDSADKIDAQIRAYTPWPGCYTTANGQQLRILKGAAASKIADQDTAIPKNTSAVAGTVLAYIKQRGILVQTGDGVLIVTELQWQAKKAMDYKSFMNGARNFIGSILE